MDLVVVQDDVDAACPRIVVPDQLPELPNEQVAVLAVRFDAGESPGACVQRSGQVTLFVLARREHRLLRSRQHVIWTDLRVQVNVDFVRVTR